MRIESISFMTRPNESWGEGLFFINDLQDFRHQIFTQFISPIA